jgi:hypothetical protein
VKQLLAFKRHSEKAKVATANLTRSATLAEAMERIFLQHSTKNDVTTTIATTTRALNMTTKMMNQYNRNDVFVIHCIGADHVECQSRQTIKKMFQPIIKWIHEYNDNIAQNHVTYCSTAHENDESSITSSPGNSFLSTIKHLRIELLGPNVPKHSEEFGTMNLLPNIIPGRLHSATVVCKNCMYHDYLHASQTCSKDDINVHYPIKPNLVIAYNAGIWGYTDWHPTLKSLCSLNWPVPFIITAYTIYEAEDDAQVVEEIMEEWNRSSGGYIDRDTSTATISNRPHNDTTIDTKRCLWSAELNPYASRIVKETTSSDHIYHENGAWQAYLMGNFTIS